MSPVPDRPAGPVGQAAVNDYDSFAEAYDAETEANLLNGYYTRPAIVNLAGDVTGRRILDVGCGSGPISAMLRDRGASMAGFDSSAKMLELARGRLGPDADLRIADLARPPHAMTDAFTAAGFRISAAYGTWPAPATPSRWTRYRARPTGPRSPGSTAQEQNDPPPGGWSSPRATPTSPTTCGTGTAFTWWTFPPGTLERQAIRLLRLLGSG